MTGEFEDVAWDLSWTPAQRAYEHVHPALARLGVAKTVLVLPHADLSIDGSVTIAGERLELSATPGAQAHLWGSKHAGSWVWVHCNDLRTVDGERAPRLVRRRRVGDGAALRSRDRAEHAGGRPAARPRLHLHVADARDRQPQHVRADRLAVRGVRRTAQARRRGRLRPRPDRGRHLPRSRRRACLLLQQRDGDDAPARVRARAPGGGLAAARDIRRPRPRALRVRTAIAGARHRASRSRDAVRALLRVGASTSPSTSTAPASCSRPAAAASPPGPTSRSTSGG